MGNQDDEPQPGFDRWVSFKGQGQYYNPTLNVDGEEVEYSDSTYMTDLLTRYAVNWLDSIDTDRPFFLYLSHKDRTSVWEGKSVSVRVDPGGRRSIKNKTKKKT